jgi:hypothetical protein
MVNGVSGGVQRRSDLLEMMGYEAARRILSRALKKSPVYVVGVSRVGVSSAPPATRSDSGRRSRDAAC